MLATDLIEDLQRLMEQHGNLEVVMDDDLAPAIEFNEEDGPAVFVIS